MALYIFIWLVIFAANYINKKIRPDESQPYMVYSLMCGVIYTATLLALKYR